MPRYLAAALAALLLAGCAAKHRVPSHPEAVRTDLLFKAVALESWGANLEAAKVYEQLYEKSGETIFLQRAATALMRAKRYDEAVALLERAVERHQDGELYALLGQAYFSGGDLKRAKEALQKAISLKKDARYYRLLATIALKEKEYEKALRYLKSAYAIDPSPETANSIAYIMYFYLDSPADAIAQLETHIRLYGCEESVCHTLATIYGAKNDIDGLISVYRRLFEHTKKPEYAKKLVELYLYSKSYDEAAKYAKAAGDDELLLEILAAQKRFDEAERLATRLYERTKDARFLALSAIYLYEGAKERDQELVEEVARRLERAVEQVSDPLYLNYLGYLLIDHDLDVERGVELVKKALEGEPDSPYYLDSLAWGYYKLGRCKEAYELIRRVYYELGLKDEEVRDHLEKIEQCQKERNDTR